MKEQLPYKDTSWDKENSGLTSQIFYRATDRVQN